MYVEECLTPWWEVLTDELPGLRVFDAHTHVGTNDPEGFRATVDELLTSLSYIDGRAAVFPLKEPDGYSEPNRKVLEAAAESGGRLVAFARIDPGDDPIAEAERCVDSGALGLKLHPSGDEFPVDDPRLTEVFELASERRLPIVVHAAYESPGAGRQTLDMAARHPGARLILAHAGISDLSWIWRELEDYPNVFFDTSWWTPSAILALFARVPAGRILFGSDLPYSTPLQAAICAVRCSLEMGLQPNQIQSVMGGQFEQLLARAEPLDFGQAAGDPPPLDPMLERAYADLVTLDEPLQRGDDAGTGLELARCACRVTDDDAVAPVCRSIEELLDRYERFAEENENLLPHAPGRDIALTAVVVARTPRAPLP